MLDLFLREPEQCAQPRLFTVDVSLGLLERLLDDELLDEGEDVAGGIADDLVQLALLVLVETGESKSRFFRTSSSFHATLRECEGTLRTSRRGRASSLSARHARWAGGHCSGACNPRWHPAGGASARRPERRRRDNGPLSMGHRCGTICRTHPSPYIRREGRYRSVTVPRTGRGERVTVSTGTNGASRALGETGRSRRVLPGLRKRLLGMGAASGRLTARAPAVDVIKGGGWAGGTIPARLGRACES